MEKNRCQVRKFVRNSEDDELFSPIQLGVGVPVPGGAEAAIHFLRHYVNTMGDDDILVKLNFTNAFNTQRRDSLIETIAKFIPELYCFVHATYSGEPILQFMNHIIRPLEGLQQGDPLASLEFCCSIHPLLKRRSRATSWVYG